MKRCESCGIPLHKAPDGGGTEADGKTRSEKYCSLCYGEGKFFFKGTDAREFQNMVLEIMVKNGWWRPVAWLFTREIPRLPRWSGKPRSNHP